MNGSGSPVTGMIRIVIPILTKMWKANIEATPATTRNENRSLAATAIESNRNNRMENYP